MRKYQTKCNDKRQNSENVYCEPLETGLSVLIKDTVESHCWWEIIVQTLPTRLLHILQHLLQMQVECNHSVGLQIPGVSANRVSVYAAFKELPLIS
jgi:hypothetical protein